MTTEAKNELIRYPVAVCSKHAWRVVDARGTPVLCVSSYAEPGEAELAAEIVRVLNAYHDEQSTNPEPVTASGEPSEAAMEAARRWFESGAEVTDGELARIIDAAFAAELAEAAELRDQVCSLLDTSSEYKRRAESAERERDEAKVVIETQKAVREKQMELLQARVKELEAELAKATKRADSNFEIWKLAEFQVQKLQECESRLVAQLRSDLDEAVGLLDENDFYEGDWVKHALAGWNTRRIKFLDRLSKPSKPGNCSDSGSDRKIVGVALEDIPKNEAGWIRVLSGHYIADLNEQLAERDAEIERLNSVLAGVREIIHSSSTEKVV